MIRGKLGTCDNLCPSAIWSRSGAGEGVGGTVWAVPSERSLSDGYWYSPRSGSSKSVSKGPSGTPLRTKFNTVKRVRTETLYRKHTSVEIRNTADNRAVCKHRPRLLKLPRFAIEAVEHPEFRIDELSRKDGVFQRGLQRNGNEHGERSSDCG